MLVGAVAEPRLIEHSLDDPFGVRDALEAREQAQVLGDGKPRVERRLLGRPPDREQPRARARADSVPRP